MVSASQLSVRFQFKHVFSYDYIIQPTKVQYFFGSKAGGGKFRVVFFFEPYFILSILYPLWDTLLFGGMGGVISTPPLLWVVERSLV